MFVGLAMPADAAENPAMTKRLYADALSGLPPADAIPVLRLFRIGDLGDGKWCPKPGEIRQAILERIGRRAVAERQERAIADQVAARSEQRGPQTPEERSRVQAMVDQFKAGVPQDPLVPARHRAPTEKEAQAWLDENAARVKSGDKTVVPISAALAEQLGVRPLVTPEEIDKFARETL